MTRQPTPGVHENFAASLDESGLTSGFGADAALLHMLRARASFLSSLGNLEGSP